jgi:hypothetical protein
MSRLVAGGGVGGVGPRAVVRVGILLAAVSLLGGAIVVAGAPARRILATASADVVGRVPHDVDPATLPAISVDQEVLDWNHEISGSGAQELVLTLAENLQLETQALLRADGTILEAVDHGDRLEEMTSRLQDAGQQGITIVDQYQIDAVNVALIVPFGRQDGLSLGLESRGTLTTETYDAAGNLQERVSSPFAGTFVMGRPTGGRWLNVAVLPLDDDAPSDAAG